jgi:hypothetical protein
MIIYRYLIRVEDAGHKFGRHQDHCHREHSHPVLHNREYQVDERCRLPYSVPDPVGSGSGRLGSDLDPDPGLKNDYI